MNQKHGFAYLEGDAFFVFVNPFLDPNEGNTLGFLSQTPMKNVPRSMIDAFVKANKEFDKINQFQMDAVQWENTQDCFVEVAKLVEIQRQRFGGDFVVSLGVPDAAIRDAIRQVSPDVIFFNLELSKETQKARCLAQNGELGEQIIQVMVSLYDQYKGPEDGEMNTFAIGVDGTKDAKHVVNEIMQVLDDLKPKTLLKPVSMKSSEQINVQPKSFFSKLLCK